MITVDLSVHLLANWLVWVMLPELYLMLLTKNSKILVISFQHSQKLRRTFQAHRHKELTQEHN